MAASKRILFFVEGVTMAHVARPLFLAAGLAAENYQLAFAGAPSCHGILAQQPWPLYPLHSLSGEQFLANLARGRRLYSVGTLRDYVRADLQLIEQIRPDLIVGDFRLSLSVSARVSQTPYLAIVNAYWSPFATQRFPLPVHPIVGMLGLPLAQLVFRAIQPLAFAHHAGPLNRVRREYGLASLGRDLRRVYTDADHVLYADVPEMMPVTHAPANHHYLGPILWSPQAALPYWWHALPNDRPIVYATLGSSGSAAALSMVCEALADLPLSLMVATAQRSRLQGAPANAYVADYLPGMAAMARADLAICNGGSLSVQQALSAGVPVLGIASNMDQFLSMQAVTAAQAGATLRADRLRSEAIRAQVLRLLNDASFKLAAQSLAKTLARYPARERFAQVVRQVLG